MRVLITAGSTSVKIDQVRTISNIFKGRTGAAIADYFAKQGVRVTLVTSDPTSICKPNLESVFYKYYHELANILAADITNIRYDAIIHSAAVSDYKVEGVYYQDMLLGKLFEFLSSYRSCLADGNLGEAKDYFELLCVVHDNLEITRKGNPLRKLDSSKKVPSQYKELFLKMTQTDKLIDKIRNLWSFKGKLVKFKLQVGLEDSELIEIAKKSREHSDADYIVANCLEWCAEKAYVIGADFCNSVLRDTLPETLYNLLIIGE